MTLTCTAEGLCPQLRRRRSRCGRRRGDPVDERGDALRARPGGVGWVRGAHMPPSVRPRPHQQCEHRCIGRRGRRPPLLQRARKKNMKNDENSDENYFNNGLV